MTRLTRAVPVVAMLAVGAAAALVAPAGPALAGPDTPSTPWGSSPVISVVLSSLDDTSWTYGNSPSYWVPDPRQLGRQQYVATSSTPQVCKVATDAHGAPTGVLQLVDVGVCTVAFHLDGDATHAPIDSVVTHAVAPRALGLSCRDTQRASDEPNPVLTPVISNLAPWDAPGQFTVRPGPISASLAPGRWPVSLVTDSTVNPHTGAARYVVNSVPCTLTVNPVLHVTGMPGRTAANLVVDGKPVTGNRLVFPYGSTVSYSVAPVLGGTALIPGMTNPWPEAWFASASTGTISGDTTVSYQTFGDLVSASPFPDVVQQQVMDSLFHQLGWIGIRRDLTAGYDLVPEDERLSRLRSNVTSLQTYLESVPFQWYLGSPDSVAAA
ncbi:MAG TPA: hypothetical protein VH085_15045, partial [Nocardioides sp.]|nr:hypothetical protein [Nocardioides sp.]